MTTDANLHLAAPVPPHACTNTPTRSPIRSDSARSASLFAMNLARAETPLLTAVGALMPWPRPRVMQGAAVAPAVKP